MMSQWHHSHSLVCLPSIHLSLSFLLFSSLSFPSLRFSISSLSLSPSSPSSTIPLYLVSSLFVNNVACWVHLASLALRWLQTAVNIVWMWLGNSDGFLWHHLSSISQSFALCSEMLLFSAMVSSMAQSITEYFVSQSSHTWCWPDWP